MTKQTFQIPDGCKAITVEQVGNQLVTTFEVESKFKKVDVVISEDGRLCIFKQYTGIDGFESYLSNSEQNNFGWDTKAFYLATPEEAQRLWDALAKQDKRWNPETMQVEEIKKDRWRAKNRENYYRITSTLAVMKAHEYLTPIDDFRHETGNYFRTEEQAERAIPYLQKALDEFWKEELK